jgi:hypothetical protein
MKQELHVFTIPEHLSSRRVLLGVRFAHISINQSIKSKLRILLYIFICPYLSDCTCYWMSVLNVQNHLLLDLLILLNDMLDMPAPEFTPGFTGGSLCSYLSFCVSTCWICYCLCLPLNIDWYICFYHVVVSSVFRRRLIVFL